MAGTKETSIRSYNFFVDGTVVAGGYAANHYEFIDVDNQTPFVSHSILLVNDSGTDPLTFRFTADPGGGGAHGQLGPSEQLQLDYKRARRIFISGATGESFRLWAW